MSDVAGLSAELLAPWYQVAEQADAFFERVLQSSRGQMCCAPGCDGCCQHDLTVMTVEALALEAGLVGLDAAARAAVGRGPGCALLAHGRCLVYAHRPLICRTHGLPIRQPAAAEEQAAFGRALAAGVSACPLNFRTGAPDPDSVLDATRLTAALTVADALVRQALQLPQPGRHRISDVARGRARVLR